MILHSPCEWASRRRPRPRAGWHPYVLFTSAQSVPPFVDREAYHRRVVKTHIDWVPGGDKPRQAHLVLWSLEAGTAPPQSPFRCEFHPRL